MVVFRRILIAPVWTAAVFIGASVASCVPSSTTNHGSGGASGGSKASGGSGGRGGTAGSTTGGSTSGGSESGSGGTYAGGAGGMGGSNATGGSSGNGGSSGAGGSTGADTATDTAPPTPSRGPTTGSPGHNFPFPQNRENSRCTYPALYRNEDVKAIYTQWKNDNVTSDGANGFRRVKRSNEPGLEKNSTVSEGIAYGMLIAVFMDDQDLFDDLWQYEQKWLDGGSGLMNWYINAAGSGLGSNPSGAGPATDADEDFAFALVVADKQWGGQGKLGKKYSDLAKDQIHAVWVNEIWDYKYIKPWPADGQPPINLSYFAPAYHRVFAKIDTTNVNPSTKVNYWLESLDAMYKLLDTTVNSSGGNASYGLVPAWSDLDGKPNGGAFGASGGASPTNYQYDSCRVPFRIGVDYCWNGESRAKDYVTKTSSFFSGVVGGATKIVDGYGTDGSPQPQYQKDSNAQVQSAAFVGPAAVGAMSSSANQKFLNDAYGVLTAGKAVVGGTYYDESWMTVSLLMMTANFLDYSSL
jgi:endo-1,4-beta-D-glucanase Y